MSVKFWFWCLPLGYSPFSPIQMFCWLPLNSFLNAGLSSNPYSQCFLWALFCRQELKDIRKLNLLNFGLLLCGAHTHVSALGRGSEVGSNSEAGGKAVKADARPLQPAKASPGLAAPYPLRMKRSGHRSAEKCLCFQGALVLCRQNTAQSHRRS